MPDISLFVKMSILLFLHFTEFQLDCFIFAKLDMANHFHAPYISFSATFKNVMLTANYLLCYLCSLFLPLHVLTGQFVCLTGDGTWETKKINNAHTVSLIHVHMRNILAHCSSTFFQMSSFFLNALRYMYAEQ